jgi:NADPH:quinone reductase-like Zn-dependent oxidoreductase
VKGVAVGDEVIGFTNNRASHAEYVLVDAANLTPKPAEIPWEVAGALFVAGVTGVATVGAVAPTPGEAVVIAGAGGGVSVFAVRTGACVIALASERHFTRACASAARFLSPTAMASVSASPRPPGKRR